MVRRLARWLTVAAGSVLLGLVLIGAGAYGHFLRSGPAPALWHRVPLSDFTVRQADEVRSLVGYLELEQRLFAELQERVYAPGKAAGDRSTFSRYAAGSRSDPGVWPVNWNRTFHFEPAPGSVSRGAALLLHGLTDSPYSMRSIGEHLAARGFEVVGLRLPGHGTAPSGLLSFQVEDMQAAVRLVAQDLHARAPQRPLYVVGYSNGAALAVDYALSVLDGEPLPRPAGVILLSPMIGVSPLAMVGRFKTGLSSLPGFERAAWEEVTTEFDPYKYTSFSFHAAGETHRLARDVARRVAKLSDRQPIRDFPPLLAFMSTVDSTVRAEAVTDGLLDHLAPGRHELVLFDVNRFAPVQQLLVNDPGPLTRALRARPQRPYALSVITNATDESLQVVELRTPQGSAQTTRRELALAWPPTVFSLSHVALPFPPDDPLYGYESAGPSRHVQLGSVAVRGENGVLTVPMWALTRQRSNPFHAYLLERIDGFLDDAGAR